MGLYIVHEIGFITHKWSVCESFCFFVHGGLRDGFARGCYGLCACAENTSTARTLGYLQLYAKFEFIERDRGILLPSNATRGRPSSLYCDDCARWMAWAGRSHKLQQFYLRTRCVCVLLCTSSRRYVLGHSLNFRRPEGSTEDRDILDVYLLWL